MGVRVGVDRDLDWAGVVTSSIGVMCLILGVICDKDPDKKSWLFLRTPNDGWRKWNHWGGGGGFVGSRGFPGGLTYWRHGWGRPLDASVRDTGQKGQFVFDGSNFYDDDQQDDATSRCLWDMITRSNVSRVFCQWEMIVHICTESEQLKTKWNPGKFWRKCSFSDFLAKMGVFWGWKKSLSSWNQYLDFISDWFIDSSR